jgi:PAS domain S-box-containing protein
LLLAFWISNKLQRPISGTVLRLAETARVISSKKDYSARAAPSESPGELELLTNTFNEMLSQIQQRDEALGRARQEVDLRVQERTAELAAANKELESSREEMDRFFTLSLDLFCVAGFDGYFKRLNPVWERVMGWTTEELLSKPLLEFVHPDDREATIREIRNQQRGEAVLSFKNRYRCKDGSYRWLSWKSIPVEKESLMYAAARDITESKKEEEGIRRLNEDLERRTAELAATNKELEAFTYSVSHDLRAPLRHIDGFSKLLMEEHSAEFSEDGREYLSLIRDSTREMGQLVDDLLNLARVGRTEITPQITGLDALVAGIVTDLKRENAGREIEWNVQKLPFVECDPGLIRQVFVNLLSNSVKYSRPRKPAMIEVGELEQAGEQVLYVGDNGVGFNMKNAGKLFGVFQRLHRQEDFEGTGVGLATVQRIIHKHGGRVWAEAELDKGAKFYFTLTKSKNGKSSGKPGEGDQQGDQR